MNDNIMRAAGFFPEVKKVRTGHCPFCNLHHSLMYFRDDLSRREYYISGLCQKCQDETFGR